MSDNNPPELPEESGPEESQARKKPSNEVQKIHGVLRVRPVPQDLPPPTTSEAELMSQQDGPWERGKHIFCPRCGRANSPRDVICRWCGAPIDSGPLPDREPSTTLFQAYKETLFRASAEGLASEVSGASWKRVWIGLAIAAVTSTIVQLLVALLYSGIVRNLNSITIPGTPVPGSGGTAVGGGTLITSVQIFPSNFLLSQPTLFFISPISTLVGFFLSALIIYWLCRRFGGVGRTGIFGHDFMVHSYLLSLVTVPLGLAADLFSFVPLAGGCIALLIAIYGIRLQYFAIRASMQMTRGNARSAMILQIVVWFVIIMVIFCGVFAFALSGLRGTLEQTLSTLRTPTP